MHQSAQHGPAESQPQPSIAAWADARADALSRSLRKWDSRGKAMENVGIGPF